VKMTYSCHEGHEIQRSRLDQGHIKICYCNNSGTSGRILTKSYINILVIVR